MTKRTRKYRPGKRGKPAQVLVKVWVDVRTLGRLALIVGLMRVRGSSRASMTEALSAVMRGGTKPLLRGASVEELNAAVEVASRTYTAVEPLLRAVVDAARDTSIPARAAGPSVTE